MPSLFVDVKGLYRDASKMAAVGEIVEQLVVDLEAENLRDDGMSHVPPQDDILIIARIDPTPNHPPLGILLSRSPPFTSTQH